ncbi:hypothetical protein DBR42_00225 [Pelomonas sp. HMWF004]|nr:hypothetical protein DBR42_00225 [Pelomonas sp. HMWF004]
MQTAPFIHSPDSFWLRLMHQPAELEVRPYVTPFGETDELLCYVDGTLIGMAIAQPLADELLIALLPTLDKSRAYPWPSVENFEAALAELLRLPGQWSLRSERDTDQLSVPELGSRALLDEKLASLIQYCVGATLGCPTFHASSEKLDAQPSAELSR